MRQSYVRDLGMRPCILVLMRRAYVFAVSPSQQKECPRFPMNSGDLGRLADVTTRLSGRLPSESETAPAASRPIRQSHVGSRFGLHTYLLSGVVGAANR